MGLLEGFVFPVDPHFYTSLLAEHPYVAAAAVFSTGCVFFVYRLIALACRLRYGYLITRQEPERAAEIIDATLRRPRRRRRPPAKGG
jgi:hypothetical protein